jgi:tetratricopeptide (TPR) repeat protein
MRIPLLLVLLVPPAVLAARSPEAQSAFERAERALSGGRFAEAEAAYKEALAASPGDAESENGLGSALFRQGKPDEAVTHFKAALRSEPALKLGWFNLAYVQRKVGDFAGAAESYARYVQLAPTDPDGYFGLAESHRQSGRRAEAMAAYEAYLAKETRPDKEKVRVRATEALAALKAQPESAATEVPAAAGASQAAKAPVDTATSLGANGARSAAAPAPAETPLGIGAVPRATTPGASTAPGGAAVAPAPSALAGQGGTGSAAVPGAAGLPAAASPQAVEGTSISGAIATPATASEPTPPPTVTAAAPAPANAALSQAKLAEGDALAADKRFREASFAYQDAVNADGSNVAALFKLGRSYAVLGYYQQAIDRWRRVAQIAVDPSVRQNAEENIRKAEAKLASQGGGSPPSQGLPPGATATSPESARAAAKRLYEDGVKRIVGRDYGGALTSLTEALRNEPNLSVAWVARGSAHVGLRRYAEAAADYQRALQLDPNRASPLYGLGESYRALGRQAEARGFYQRYAAATAPDIQPTLQADAKRKADLLR